jgi:hypothetical protein
MKEALIEVEIGIIASLRLGARVSSPPPSARAQVVDAENWLCRSRGHAVAPINNGGGQTGTRVVDAGGIRVS